MGVVVMTLLRPIEIGDAPAVARAVDCSRDALRRWMVWYRDAYGVSDAQRWIELALDARADGTGFHFAICDTTGSFVGVISLEGVTEAGRSMLGYWIATPATGRGIGRRAVADILAWARENSRIRVVWALVAESNQRSRRVLEANGFAIVDVRPADERGDTPLVYEVELRAASASSGPPRTELTR